MTDTEKIIDLTYRRQDFEDIYFKNGHGSIFWHPGVKGPFLISLILAITFCVSLGWSILSDNYIVLTVMSFLCLLFTCFIYYRQAIQVWNWKQTIYRFLNELSRIKKHELILTPHSITIKRDSEESIEKWSAITQATIKEDYISLKGGQDYFFLKKSMSETEFKYLRDIVSEKIKNGD